MKVAQVLLRYDAPGGVETMVREITRKLHERHLDLRVFASNLYNEATWAALDNPSREVDGVLVERLGVARELVEGITMPVMPGLVEKLVEWQPNVIHAHSHRYGHLLQSTVASDLSSSALVVSTHYHPADTDETPWSKAMLRTQDHLFGVTVYRQARAVIVETQHEKQQLSDFIDVSKMRIVPPGLAREVWETLPTPAAAHERLNLPEEYILFAGRLAPNKGLTTLLEAWAGLAPAERLPLVLLGKDWGMKALLEQRAVELGVEKEIVFLGHRASMDDYVSAFAGASLFVLPSSYEAFGLVLLEAMACALPIVATRVGGVPEVVVDGETATLVPYEDVWELRRGIREFIEDRERARRFGRAGRERVYANFSWDKTATQLAEIYAEVA